MAVAGCIVVVGVIVDVLFNNRRDPSTTSSGRAIWHDAIVGSLGEYAASVMLGEPFRAPTFAQRHDGDIGPRWEARATELHNGHLIIRPWDIPTRPFLLVTGRPPGPFHLRGAMLGADAMREDYELQPGQGPNPRSGCRSYWVPQDALLPVDDVL